MPQWGLCSCLPCFALPGHPLLPGQGLLAPLTQFHHPTLPPPAPAPVPAHEPGKLHSDYKTHSHFLPNLGGKVHLIIQKIRQIPSALTLSWEEPRVLSSESTSCPLPGMENRSLYQWNFMLCVQPGRRKAESFFLCLQFLSFLQLKIILMPKWHILGWHVWSPPMLCGIPSVGWALLLDNGRCYFCDWVSSWTLKSTATLWDALEGLTWNGTFF